MSKAATRLVLALAVLALGACDGGTPTAPSVRSVFEGVWSGAVTQGGNLALTVSAQQAGGGSDSELFVERMHGDCHSVRYRAAGGRTADLA